jgi:hypothetical protein
MLENAIGWSNYPDPGCVKIAPSFMVDASTCMWNVFSQTGNISIGVVTIFSFRVSNPC